MINPAERLRDIDAAVRVCTLCPLADGRIKAVPGEGPIDAGIMFIGEAPGFNENQQGRPFVGAAGQFLEELLQIIGLHRRQVYITNIVKCRPPNNRDPLEEELAACTPYLDEQIALIDPPLVATLGRFSMGRFFPRDMISRIHGSMRVVDGRSVVPLYHPAAALRQQALRRVLEDDFRKLPRFLAEAKARRAASDESNKNEPPPQQLSLF